eukprot:scaffold9329_cov51-Attheya_sp.AAC.7
MVLPIDSVEKLERHPNNQLLTFLLWLRMQFAFGSVSERVPLLFETQTSPSRIFVLEHCVSVLLMNPPFSKVRQQGHEKLRFIICQGQQQCFVSLWN